MTSVLLTLTAAFLLLSIPDTCFAQSIGNRSTSVNPNSTSKKKEIIELDKISINLPCPPGVKPQPGFECGNTIIKVKNNYLNRKGKILPVKYEISGGKLIGVGNEIDWNLSGIRPGTYIISALVIKKDGTVKIASKTVTVKQCEACGGDCECASEMKVSRFVDIPKDEPLAALKPSVEITLVGNISGGSQIVTSYHWKIEGGKIIDGQGTPQVKVRINSDAKEVVAIVEFGGLCADCVSSASATFEIDLR